MSIRWLADSKEDDRVVFRIGRDGSRLHAEWIDLATLDVERDGTGAVFRPSPGTDVVLAAKIERGVVRALLRHLRGEMSLHASAVASGDGAMAFLGDSRAGKSTLAYALATLGHRDLRLLSDDCLAVNGTDALPTEEMSWLDPLARTAFQLSPNDGKSSVAPTRVAADVRPIRTLVALGYAETFGVRTIRGAEAARLLARAMIRFVIDEPEVLRHDMDRAAALSEAVDVVALTRPKGLQHIEETLKVIEDLI